MARTALPPTALPALRHTFEEFMTAYESLHASNDELAAENIGLQRKIRGLELQLAACKEKVTSILLGLPPYTREEVTELLHVERTTLYRWIKQGKFPKDTLGRWPRHIVHAHLEADKLHRLREQALKRLS